jgi:hypothetical protein
MAGWRESRERRRRLAGKFNQVRSPFLRRLSAPTISAHTINTDVLIGHAANKGYGLS